MELIDPVQRMAPLAEVEGKVAFVTGGSSGIGLGIAEAFAEAGMKVVITYRSPAHLDEALRVLAPYGERIHAIEMDVADRPSVERAAAETLEHFGAVHVLVANAGVAVIKEVAEASYEDWDWQIAVNLTGVFNSIHVFLPLIRQHGEGGQIVATSSIMGLFTSRGHSLYSASKFGVVGLLEGLRLDLLDTEVGVSIYCPGNVWANLDIRSTTQPDSAPREEPNSAARWQRIREERGPIEMDQLEAGRLVLAGVRRNDLYILTHPEFGWMIDERHRAIEAAHPTDLVAPPERVANATPIYHNPIYSNAIRR